MFENKKRIQQLENRIAKLEERLGETWAIERIGIYGLERGYSVSSESAAEKARWAERNVRETAQILKSLLEELGFEVHDNQPPIKLVKRAKPPKE